MTKLPDTQENAVKNQILEGSCRNPHEFLGMHQVSGGVIVRVYDPAAELITVIAGKNRYPMLKVDDRGIFSCFFGKKKDLFAYKIEKKYADSKFTSADPYCFLPTLGEMDIYLFNQGEHQRVYDVMGAHVRNLGGVEGVSFAVWAPNAQRVSVVGDFNCWDGRRHPMRMLGLSGIWELFIPGLKPGDVYKFEVKGSDGSIVLKLDPYARRTELRPNNAGIVPQAEPFQWTDDAWMKKRAATNPVDSPMNIYEVHLGTWGGPGLKLPEVKETFNNYRELAVALADYVQKMGYTHVELLPVMEHPLDQSWGYQVTGFYAPTARYGSPEDFAWFMNYMHEHGIGVFLDWVPAHFPRDTFSLGRFDGTALYEHADPRKGEQKDWGTYIFNFGRNEVRQFLIGSALFWLDQYHADGLRVDAVASMLYLNYSRNDGEWIPNEYGGCENLEAIAFIRHLNELAHKLYPGISMIAEESTSWPGVSRPIYLGGLGFTFKWNMGWMHDTLDYFKLDPIYRSYHHGQLAFSICYAFSENFILPFSHDEVVHGKLSLFGRMSGDYVQKFANLRAMYVLMATHPGKKLIFMGGEFAQVIEWNCNNQSVDWLLLKYPAHDSIHRMTAELNKFYLSQPALWEDDFTPAGFQWLDGGDFKQSIYSFIRWDKNRKAPLVVILNLTPVVRDDFNIGVPLPGEWVEVFNTDREEYGGTGLLNGQKMVSSPGEYHGQKQFITLRLPWLGAVVLAPKSAVKKAKK
ncbi:MAG: 1,4-alpha-glucan branching protein GlgB [Lentisphaeria bacterium]|nr:1,4-alpha-glucan branching protein GlgB [Lentisphaeria bacterium]